MSIVEQLQKSIAEATGTEASSVHLEHPQDLSHGDYATNIAMVLAKKQGVNPKELAEEIAGKINLPFVEKVEVAGPGFINFKLSRAFFTESLKVIEALGVGWGTNLSKKDSKIIVEYTDPNPFKEMHIGHFMSNAIGEAIARLMQATGAEVKHVTYQGDVGPHVAKALYGMQQLDEKLTPEFIGCAYAHGAEAYESDPAAKEEIDTINQKIYKGEDKELMELYERGRSLSLEEFETVYELLGSTFAHNFFESETTPIGLKLVEEGLKNGVFEESDGAVVYKGEDEGLHTRVFRTSKGTPTYETKDLGLQPLKNEWWEHDESIIITAHEQKSYFEVMLAAMRKLMPDAASKIRHIAHGLMKLPEGKMSSRSGNVIKAKNLIIDVQNKVLTQSPDETTALQIAVGALKYAVLKQQSGNDVVFDFEKSLSLDGDSGPYLQYALVRAKKILADSKKSSDTSVPETPYNLEKLLYRFPEVVARAQELYEPHHVTQYLTEIASEFNSFYAQEKILGGEHEGYKLLLVQATAYTLENGLWLLGMPAPERM